MSPQEHAQAQTLYYSELHPVANDTLNFAVLIRFYAC